MSLGNAFSYLTILPIPYKRQVPLLRSVHFFPLVGAGMGSLLALFFVGSTQIVPAWLIAPAIIGLLEWMTGGAHLRAVGELAMGRRTFPGHGFGKPTPYSRRGLAAIITMLAIKAAALLIIVPGFQPYAVLLLPICGRCAQTLGIVFSRHRQDNQTPDAAMARRRIRAVFLTVLLGFLLFLLPLRIGAFLALEYGIGLTLWYRVMNSRNQGLTVQTLGAAAAFSETLFLVSLALLSRI